jgi:hypothetical protein
MVVLLVTNDFQQIAWRLACEQFVYYLLYGGRTYMEFLVRACAVVRRRAGPIGQNQKRTTETRRKTKIEL